MSTETMLTTFDNPYDPFDAFNEWFMYDIGKGYYTCSLLARIAKSSDDFSTIEDKRETERAIDVIINNDFLNIYKKVTRTVENTEEETKEDEDDDEVEENDTAEVE